MARALTCLHHVTATVGEAQKDLDFYVGTLGLRLVKRTVNFDDVTAGANDGRAGEVER